MAIKKLTELPDADHIQDGDTLYLVQDGASKKISKRDMDQAILRTVTSGTAITTADEVLRCNGTFAVTLPAATGSGDLFLVKNIGSGTVTITPDGSDTIDGLGSYALVGLERVVVLDGAAGNWDVL